MAYPSNLICMYLVPDGLDPTEAVSLVLNYVTGYQMMHRSARVSQGQRVLIHAAAGGVGTAQLQFGQLAGLEMYGTASKRNHDFFASFGATPIDFRMEDFVAAIHRLTGDGVAVVFDGIGGSHVWRSYRALRPGGRVIAYGLTENLKNGRLANGARSRARAVFYRLSDCRRLPDPGPQTDRPLQHPNAETVQTGLFS